MIPKLAWIGEGQKSQNEIVELVDCYEIFNERGKHSLKVKIPTRFNLNNKRKRRGRQYFGILDCHLANRSEKIFEKFLKNRVRDG